MFVLIFYCYIKINILDIVGDMLDQELLSTELAGVSDESERIKVMISGVNTQEADTDWGHWHCSHYYLCSSPLNTQMEEMTRT